MSSTKNADPLVSFVVLSYNYEKYVGQTIKSILDQTVQDLEVIVVDDNSKDRSAEVIKSINDPRVRLHVNERNMGGAWGVNKALEMARGRYIANLDSDDWIHPRKTELQLAFLRKKPRVSIVGSYVDFRDADGNRHPSADQIEAGVNNRINFNHLESWVIKNNMCRSSTLLERRFHDQHGLVESEMVYAADFELWTRALRVGEGIDRVEEPLTYYRLHTKNVTFANPMGTFFEFAYIMAKNLIPDITAKSQFIHLPTLFQWLIENPNFAQLKPTERYRLLGRLAAMRPEASYGKFREAIENCDEQAFEQIGRSVLALFRLHPSKAEHERLSRDISQYELGRDWWRKQAENWEGEYRRIVDNGLGELEKARDWWRDRAEYWERMYAEQANASSSHQLEASEAPAIAAPETSTTEDAVWWQAEARRWQSRCVLAAQENSLLLERLGQALQDQKMPPAAYGKVRPSRTASALAIRNTLVGRALRFLEFHYRIARERHGQLPSAVIALLRFGQRGLASARYRIAKLLFGDGR